MVRRRVRDTTRADHPGVVHEHIELSVSIANRVDDGTPVVVIGDVADERSSALSERLGCCAKCRLAPGDDPDPHPDADERVRDRQTYPTVGTGDERHPALEVRGHESGPP